MLLTGSQAMALGADSFATGHSEGAHAAAPHVELRHFAEVPGVLFVRRGIPPFDVIKPQTVQPPSQQELVVKRKADALGLGPVPQSRVIDLDTTHGSPSHSTKNALRPWRASGLMQVGLVPLDAPRPGLTNNHHDRADTAGRDRANRVGGPVTHRATYLTRARKAMSWNLQLYAPTGPTSTAGGTV